jgi:hypothetical protein
MRLSAWIAAAIVAFSASAASAGNIAFGTYYYFFFGDDNSPATPPGSGPRAITGALGESATAFDPGAQPWTINLAQPGTLYVFDAYLKGDVFEAFANGFSLGLTSAPFNIGGNCGADLLCAATTGGSTGTFALDPGSYALSFIVRSSPFNTGAGFFWVGPRGVFGQEQNPPFGGGGAVSEPATLALIGAGVLGLAAMRRRIRR